MASAQVYYVAEKKPFGKLQFRSDYLSLFTVSGYPGSLYIDTTPITHSLRPISVCSEREILWNPVRT